MPVGTLAFLVPLLALTAPAAAQDDLYDQSVMRTLRLTFSQNGFLNMGLGNSPRVSLSQPTQNSVVISEFVAQNETGIRTAAGDNDDWIEFCSRRTSRRARGPSRGARLRAARGARAAGC